MWCILGYRVNTVTPWLLSFNVLCKLEHISGILGTSKGDVCARARAVVDRIDVTTRVESVNESVMFITLMATFFLY